MLHGHLSLNGNAPTNDMQKEKEISIVKGKKTQSSYILYKYIFFFWVKKEKMVVGSCKCNCYLLINEDI